MSTTLSSRDTMLAYLVCKVVSALGVYLGVYIGERELSERFVRRVYLQKKQAPALGSMVATVVLTHVLVVGACLCTAIFGIFLRRGARADMNILGTWVAIDVLMFNLFAFTIGQAMASNISNQKYFNYKLEGLRAIRALRRMLGRALVPLAAVPMAAAFMPAERAQFIGATLSQPFA